MVCRHMHTRGQCVGEVHSERCSEVGQSCKGKPSFPAAADSPVLDSADRHAVRPHLVPCGRGHARAVQVLERHS